MIVYRLGTDAHLIWDGTGAAAHGGRWNPVGRPAIYAAGTLSLAMLERLVQRRNLGRTLFVSADLPDDLTIDDLMATPPGGWRALGSPEAAAAGGAWLRAADAAVLRVPSALVPTEANYMINPLHRDAARIVVSAPQLLAWDARLFDIPPPR
jgi:RES domain-containing protein